jgi:hypothetical protein
LLESTHWSQVQNLHTSKGWYRDISSMEDFDDLWDGELPDNIVLPVVEIVEGCALVSDTDSEVDSETDSETNSHWIESDEDEYIDEEEY